jgi:hypothetical protein
MNLLLRLKIGLILSTLIISCVEENEPDEEVFINNYFHHKISKNLYPYLFDPGSYWLYNTSENDLIDSIYLDTFKIDTLYIGPSEPGQGPLGEEQYYELTYQSSLSGEYKEYLFGYVISRGFIYGGYIFISTNEIGDIRGNVKLKEIHDSLVINNKIYYDVKEMEIAKEYYVNYETGNMLDPDSIDSMNMFFVDSVGLVKKVIKENKTTIETWNLLNYNVSQYVSILLTRYCINFWCQLPSLA